MMKKVLSVFLSAALLLTIAACGGAASDETEAEHEYEYQEPFPEDTEYTDTAAVYVDTSPEALAWKAAVLESPLIAEVENLGVRYEVYIHNTSKYLYNTETDTLVSGSTSGDALGTVLRDWIIPHEASELDENEALFDYVWADTGSRLRSLIGFCEGNYALVTRARTSEYLEYVYKGDDAHYRVIAAGGYILYAPLMFEYIFDIDSY